MGCVRVIASGRVQGVGFRAWVEREATARALSGWVRNRRDGTVEALFCGATEAVESMIAACRDGPPAARVADLAISADAERPPAGFSVLPTA